MPDRPILLVDARNVMYRAIYAGKREDRRYPNRKRSYFVVWLRMMASWVNRYQPSKVQIFWDAPRATVWRRKLLKTYKDRPDKGGLRDIKDDLLITEQIARQVFNYLNVYQFERQGQEADDLIYAACRWQQNRRMIIISSDSDMQQIPYSMRSVTIFNPDRNVEMPTAELNPVIRKALEGDKSDCIDGYYGTGPVAAGNMVTSPSLLQEHFNQKGRTRFALNLALIDMGLNPFLLKNTLYVARALATQPVFDRTKILELEQQYKIAGITPEYSEIVAPFKLIPNK